MITDQMIKPIVEDLLRVKPFSPHEKYEVILTQALQTISRKSVEGERQRVIEIINSRPAITLTNPENNHPTNYYKLIDRNALLEILSPKESEDK